MRRVFADSCYWIALCSPRDQHHAAALSAGRGLHGAQIVTTQELLTEFLTAFRYTSDLRRIACRRVQQITADPQFLILPQTPETFHAGLTFYQSRPDKQFSLTDCISMTTMRQLAMTEVLTHDAHFAQEGFSLLL